uniref:Uncharacterized protein n=1 Tax=Vitrella brassicaformis TaxID=1169539 RepID=A0A7S1KBA1_9ALVE
MSFSTALLAQKDASLNPAAEEEPDDDDLDDEWSFASSSSPTLPPTEFPEEAQLICIPIPPHNDDRHEDQAATPLALAAGTGDAQRPLQRCDSWPPIDRVGVRRVPRAGRADLCLRAGVDEMTQTEDQLMMTPRGGWSSLPSMDDDVTPSLSPACRVRPTRWREALAVIRVQGTALCGAVLVFLVHYLVVGVQLTHESLMEVNKIPHTIPTFVWSGTVYTLSVSVSIVAFSMILNRVPGVNPTKRGRLVVHIGGLIHILVIVLVQVADYVSRWHGVVFEKYTGDMVWSMRFYVTWFVWIGFVSKYWSPIEFPYNAFINLTIDALGVYLCIEVLVPYALGYKGWYFLLFRLAIFVCGEVFYVLVRWTALMMVHIRPSDRHIFYAPVVAYVMLVTRVLQGTLTDPLLGVLGELAALVFELIDFKFCYRMDTGHAHKLNVIWKWCQRRVRQVWGFVRGVAPPDDVGDMALWHLMHTEEAKVFYEMVPLSHILSETYAVCLAPMILLYYGIGSDQGEFSTSTILTQATIQILGELVGDLIFAALPGGLGISLPGMVGPWKKLKSLCSCSSTADRSRQQQQQQGGGDVQSPDLERMGSGVDKQPESLFSSTSSMGLSQAWKMRFRFHFSTWFGLVLCLSVHFTYLLVNYLSHCLNTTEDGVFVTRWLCDDYFDWGSDLSLDWTQKGRGGGA